MRLLGHWKAPRKSSGHENHLPGKAGKPWSGAEDKLLIDHFKAAMLTKELAQQHNRTEGTI
jgi:hypothetical protein